MKSNSFLRRLKPTPTFLVLFILVLLAQKVLFATASYSFSVPYNDSGRSTRTFGIGAPIVATTANDATTYDINWMVMIINLGCSIMVAVISAWVFSMSTRFRRPALALCVIACVMAAISFAVATGLSKSYWGYFVSRPAVLKEISRVTTVDAVIPVETESDEEGRRSIVAQSKYSIADRLAYGRNDSYYGLTERLLLALDERNLLPQTHDTDLADLPELFPLIRGSGILAKPEPGYNDSDILRGVVIDARDHSGERLVFLGLLGRQLSNDHYPYYEILFSGSTDLSYVRGQRFYYDVAGIEGFEWYTTWPHFAVIGTLVGIVIVTMVMLVWNGMKKMKNA